MVADATNASNSNQSIQTCSTANHAPYGVLNTSFTGYSLQGTELSNFAALESASLSWAYAFVTAQSGNTPPALHTYNMAQPSDPAAKGAGVEFTISANYKGLNTCCTSEVTGDMAGFVATIRYQHPTWNWADVKGAFRQTAANWSTGYNVSTYGYGAINYDAATAVASPSAVYLEGPIVQASVSFSMTTNITLTVYPFRQTRRNHEIIYAAPANYVWPVKNEYVLSDITASGAVLVWDDSTVAGNVIPSATVPLPGLGAGRWNVIGFTTDGSGGYSRVESWSPIFINGACL